MTVNSTEHLRGSFRDPSGFVFQRDGVIYRQVQKTYSQQYDLLMESGLYEELVEQKLLIPHEKLNCSNIDDACYCTLKPKQLDFVSYPYEWSMSQLKDAALTTLYIQRTALKYGMSLKDASAYNIQFVDGVPMLIDTLSFDIYRENEPWIAYGQFCRHFFAPLALMKYVNLQSGVLLRLHIDGIPLDIAAKILPLKTWIMPSILMHIIIHSRFQSKYGHSTENEVNAIRKRSFSLTAMKNLIQGLQDGIIKMTFPSGKMEWTDYYDTNNYTETAFKAKEHLVDEYISETSPGTLWDLGANDGHFSFRASRNGITTIAIDSDPTVIERCYVKAKNESNQHLHQLLIDLTNPSPALGWAHEERLSLLERGPADTVMALALIHHLAIGNNVPFTDIASFLADCGKFLIVEFASKCDSQVRRMLSTRKDIFEHYTIEDFEEAFNKYFTIKRKSEVSESDRTIYLMERRQC
ncbi:MAG: methyltransferase domain-containing protein [Armatimonadota bacterium]